LDFLQNQQRSSIFHIDLENHMNVAHAVLKALSDDNRRFDTLDNPLAWYVTLLDFGVHSQNISCVGASEQRNSLNASSQFLLRQNSYP
jgi:hypothetical protein